MEVIAIDAMTGQEHVIPVDEGEVLLTLKRKCMAAFKCDSRDDVTLSVSGAAVICSSAEAMSGVPGFCADCRVDMLPTGKRFVEDLESGKTTLRDIPRWAREQPMCLIAALKCDNARNIVLPPALCTNADVVLAMLKHEPRSLLRTDSKTRDIQDIAIAGIQQRSDLYWCLSDAMRSSTRVAQEAVKQGIPLGHLSDKLRDTYEVVHTALLERPDEFSSASERLRGDPELLKVAMKATSTIFRHASSALRGDKAFVMTLFPQYGNLLQYASEELRSDPEVVGLAMSGTSSNYRYASVALRGDAEFAKEVCRKSTGILGYATEGVRDTPEVLLAAVEQNPRSIADATPRLRDDVEFMERAVRINPACLRDAGDAPRNSRKVLLAAFSADTKCKHKGALCKCCDVLRMASAEMRACREVVVAAAAFHSHTIVFASEELRGDKEVLLAALSFDRRHPHCDSAVPLAPPAALNSCDVMLALVSREPLCISFAGEDPRADTNIAVAAVSQAPDTLMYFHPATRSHPDVVQALRAAVQARPEAAFVAAPVPALRVFYNDPKVPLALRRARLFHELPADLQAQRSIALPAVRAGACLRDVKGEARADLDVVEAAVSRCSSNILYASPALQGEGRVVAALGAGDDKTANTPTLLGSGCSRCTSIPSNSKLRDAAAALLQAAAEGTGGEQPVAASTLEGRTSLPPCLGGDAISDDEELMAEWCSTNPYAVMWASDRLHADDAFAARCLENWQSTLGLLPALKMAISVGIPLLIQVARAMMDRSQDPELLAHAPDRLRANADIILKSMAGAQSWDMCGLRYASPALLGDRDFAVKCLAIHGGTVRFLSPELRRDADLIRSINARHHMCLRSCVDSDTLNKAGVPEVQAAAAERWRTEDGRADCASFLESLRATPSLFRQAPLELRRSKEAALIAVSRDAGNIRHLPEELQADTDVALAAVEAGASLANVRGGARTDKRVALAAVRRNQLNTKFLCDELRDDAEVGRAVVARPNASFFAWLSDRLRDQPELVLKAVQQDADNFQYVGEECRSDRDILLAALSDRHKAAILFCASPALLADREVVMAAVRSNPANLAYAHAALENDPEVRAAGSVRNPQ